MHHRKCVRFNIHSDRGAQRCDAERDIVVADRKRGCGQPDHFASAIAACAPGQDQRTADPASVGKITAMSTLVQPLVADATAATVTDAAGAQTQGQAANDATKEPALPAAQLMKYGGVGESDDATLPALASSGGLGGTPVEVACAPAQTAAMVRSNAKNAAAPKVRAGSLLAARKEAANTVMTLTALSADVVAPLSATTLQDMVMPLVSEHKISAASTDADPSGIDVTATKLRPPMASASQPGGVDQLPAGAGYMGSALEQDVSVVAVAAGIHTTALPVFSMAVPGAMPDSMPASLAPGTQQVPAFMHALQLNVVTNPDKSHASAVPVQTYGAVPTEVELPGMAPVAKRLEVAVDDPDLGRIGVRAELRAGALHASIVGGDTTVSASLPQMHSYLQQQDIAVHSITYRHGAAASAGGFEGSMQGKSDHRDQNRPRRSNYTETRDADDTGQPSVPGRPETARAAYRSGNKLSIHI